MKELIQAIHFFHSRGWAPATSSNYSIRHPQQEHRLLISQSGVDKQYFDTRHLMTIDLDGRPTDDNPHLRPSAETGLHTLIYHLYPAMSCVLHTHTVANTVLSLRHSKELVFEGFEMLKGLDGVNTHEHTERIPIFDNSQDIAELARLIEIHLRQFPDTHAFLLRGHGMYTWGRTVADAKRQVEVLEFLFECQLKIDQYGNPAHTR